MNFCRFASYNSSTKADDNLLGIEIPKGFGKASKEGFSFGYFSR